MANTNINKNKPARNIGASAEQVTITEKVKEVWLSNNHATQTAAVKVYTGGSQAAATAAAIAGNTAAAVTATVDGAFHIPPANVREVCVFKSSRPTYVALDIIASGASTPINTRCVV